MLLPPPVALNKTDLLFAPELCLSTKVIGVAITGKDL